MRRLLLAILAISLFAACERNTPDPFFFWSDTDREFDSLSRDIDRAWSMDADADSLAFLIERLRMLADKDSSDRSKCGRLHYFIGRWHSAFSTYSRANPELDLAVRYFSDTVAFPYEMNRINYVRSLDPACKPDERYFINQRLLDYFVKSGDSVMAAAARTNLGNVLLNITVR